MRLRYSIALPNTAFSYTAQASKCNENSALRGASCASCDAAEPRKHKTHNTTKAAAATVSNKNPLCEQHARPSYTLKRILVFFYVFLVELRVFYCCSVFLVVMPEKKREPKEAINVPEVPDGDSSGWTSHRAEEVKETKK